MWKRVRRTLREPLPFAFLLLLFPEWGMGWGFWAHKRIHRIAVFTLPMDLLPLYKTYIDYLTEEATAPDERRFVIPDEAPKHYIDIDHYEPYPFPTFPRTWEEAVKTYSEDTLKAYGILPWAIEQTFWRLVAAFRQQNIPLILKLSADLGHYVADAHVPLHTTENYNGQLTGQEGIHALWESRIPELIGETFDYYVGPCYLIQDPLNEAWKIILESHALVPTVLKEEREATRQFLPSQKYTYENRNGQMVRNYSVPFVLAYHERLGAMVEQRIRLSILRVGSFWYSAWVLAGKPDLKPYFHQKMPLEKEHYPKQLQIIDRESLYPAFHFERIVGLHRRLWW